LEALKNTTGEIVQQAKNRLGDVSQPPFLKECAASVNKVATLAVQGSSPNARIGK
jgi:hypothetical protein